MVLPEPQKHMSDIPLRSATLSSPVNEESRLPLLPITPSTATTTKTDWTTDEEVTVEDNNPPLVTPFNAPQPPTQSPKAEAEETQYFLSPYKLCAADCTCYDPDKGLLTAQDHIEFMITRLSKLMRRMTQSPKLVSELNDAFLRVLYTLRTRGYELFHLVSWQRPKIHGDKVSKEFSIVFLVWDSGMEIRHRPIAEIMVHCADNEGKHKGMIENVAVRYDNDWEDWTVCQMHEWYRDEAAPKIQKIMLEDGWTGTTAVDVIWKDILRSITQGQRDDSEVGRNVYGSKGDFVMRLGRTVERLNHDGEVLTGFEVERVYRGSSNKGKNLKLAIRIALYAKLASASTSLSMVSQDRLIAAEVENLSLAEEKVDLDQKQEEEHIPAIMLIDLTDKRPTLKVKHICTVYDGEWPITHHYRKKIPPPKLRGLERLLGTVGPTKA